MIDKRTEFVDTYRAEQLSEDTFFQNSLASKYHGQIAQYVDN